MAYTTMILKNPKTGKITEAPVGFSWEALFMGIGGLFSIPFVIMTGDMFWVLFILVVSLVGLVFCGSWNRLTIKSLIRKGFKVKSVGSGDIEHIGDRLGLKLPLLRQGEK